MTELTLRESSTYFLHHLRAHHVVWYADILYVPVNARPAARGTPFGCGVVTLSDHRPPLPPRHCRRHRRNPAGQTIAGELGRCCPRQPLH